MSPCNEPLATVPINGWNRRFSEWRQLHHPKISGLHVILHIYRIFIKEKAKFRAISGYFEQSGDPVPLTGQKLAMAHVKQKELNSTTTVVASVNKCSSIVIINVLCYNF